MSILDIPQKISSQIFTFTQFDIPNESVKTLLKIELTCNAWKEILEGEHGHDVWRQLYISLNPKRFSFISSNITPETNWREFAIEPFKRLVAVLSQAKKNASLPPIDDDHPLFMTQEQQEEDLAKLNAWDQDRDFARYLPCREQVITPLPDFFKDDKPILDLLSEILKSRVNIVRHLADRNEKKLLVPFLAISPPISFNDAYHIFFNALHIQDAMVRNAPTPLHQPQHILTQFFDKPITQSKSFPFGYLIFKYLMLVNPTQDIEIHHLENFREFRCLNEFRLLAPMYGVPFNRETHFNNQDVDQLLSLSFLSKLLDVKSFIMEKIQENASPWGEELDRFASELGIEFSTTMINTDSSLFFDALDHFESSFFLHHFTFPPNGDRDPFAGHRPIVLAYKFKRQDLVDELVQRGATLKEDEDITPYPDEVIEEVKSKLRDSRDFNDLFLFTM